MIFDARCWTPPRVAPLIAMLWLAACATGGSDRPARMCPLVVEYSQAEQARAADEIESLYNETEIIGRLSDYAVLRQQAQACR